MIKCKTCGAVLLRGEPQYDPKSSQRMKCINYHIEKMMGRIKEINERGKCWK